MAELEMYVYRRRTRATRGILVAAAIAGTFASVLATGAPANANAVQKPVAPAPTPAPNLAALHTALQAVVSSGAPGVFAQVQDDFGKKSYTVSVG
jgi:D-alanyl-D-alanine carboxypeptidase